MQPNEMQKFQEGVALAQAGHKAEAHRLLVELAQANFYSDGNLLLWVAYTAEDLRFARNMLNRMRLVDPSNPALPGAEQWLAAEEAKQPQVPWSVRPLDPPTHSQNQAEMSSGYAAPKQAQILVENDHSNQPGQILNVPLGRPIRDGSNFLMSQTGGLLLVWAVVFLASLVYFLVSLLGLPTLLGDKTSPMTSVRGLIFLVGAGIVAGVSAWLLYQSAHDVLTPPIKAYGRITNRRTKKVDVKTRYGRIENLLYEADFISDEPDSAVVTLKLTEDQYQAGGLSIRAYVEYSSRLKTVKLYQPLATGAVNDASYLDNPLGREESPQGSPVLMWVAGSTLVVLLLIFGAVLFVK